MSASLFAPQSAPPETAQNAGAPWWLSAAFRLSPAPCLLADPMGCPAPCGPLWPEETPPCGLPPRKYRSLIVQWAAPSSFSPQILPMTRVAKLG